VDKQRRAKLLRERLVERLGENEDNARWAFYEKRSKQKVCEFVVGSLCELEMIEQCFKGKKSISVKEKKTISVHVLKDEWVENKLDDKDVSLVGLNTGQLLEGDQFLIEKGDCEPLTHGREVRSVKTWISAQFALMRNCQKPWEKDSRDDPKLPVLPDQAFIDRYFFAGMKWDGRLIQSTYFNLTTKQVFFRFVPPVP
jgi:hypothetical protein